MRQVFAAFNAMAEKGIIESYAIGGAMAISLHEQPAMTEDIDIFIAHKRGKLISMSPLFEFMKSLGAKEEDGDHLRYAGWLIHILSPKSPSLVEEALDDSESYDAGQGVTTRVCLTAIALKAGRRYHQEVRTGKEIMTDLKPYGVDEAKDREWRRKQAALSGAEKVDILDRLNDGWHFLRSMKKIKEPAR